MGCNQAVSSSSYQQLVQEHTLQLTKPQRFPSTSQDLYIFLTNYKLMHLYGYFPKIELYVVNVLTIRPFTISHMFFCRLHPVWMEQCSNCDWCSCPSGCNSTWRHCKIWRELLQEFKIAWVFNATLLFIKAASYLPRQNWHTWYMRENSSWAQWRLWRH